MLLPLVVIVFPSCLAFYIEDEDRDIDRYCIENNGYFPDEEQCDLYYECINGVATAKLCADGLLFDAQSSNEGIVLLAQ